MSFSGIKAKFIQSSLYGKEKSRGYWKKRSPFIESIKVDERVGGRLNTFNVFVPFIMVDRPWLNIRFCIWYTYCVCFPSPSGFGFRCHLPLA